MMRPVFALTLKVVAFILALFAIFFTSFVLLFLSFDRILLDPQTYKRAFTENKVYEQLPEVAAQEFALIRDHLVEPCTETVIADSCLDSVIHSSTTETNKLGIEGSTFINGLNPEQWKSLIKYLLTPEDVQKSLEAGVDEVIAYMMGERDSAGLPLLNLKAGLTNLRDEEVNKHFLNAQPLCTPEQQTMIVSGELSQAGNPPIFCSAATGTSEVLLRDLQRRLNIFAEELPEQITFFKPHSPSIPTNLQGIFGNDLKSMLKSIHVKSQYLPLLIVALLVLVAIFGARSLRGLLRWWGIPIFIGSLFALIFGIVLFFLFEQIWLSFVFARFPLTLTSDFGEILYGVAHSLSKDFAQYLMMQAAIVTLLSLGILFVSNRVPTPPDPSLPPLAPPGTPGGPVLNPNRKKKKW